MMKIDALKEDLNVMRKKLHQAKGEEAIHFLEIVKAYEAEIKHLEIKRLMEKVTELSHRELSEIVRLTASSDKRIYNKIAEFVLAEDSRG